MNADANFDGLARLYRWLEYLSLGPMLQRTRTWFLADLSGCRQALVLGDGDGRFTAALLGRYPSLEADAVDASPAMLRVLRRRTRSTQLNTVQADLRTFRPTCRPDLITTQFVLDCLTQGEAEDLIARMSAHLRPGGLWLVSDFRIPNGPLRWPARAYIRLLYFAFRLLTGLRVTHLPNHETPMRQAGLSLLREHRLLFGLLTTQLWLKTE